MKDYILRLKDSVLYEQDYNVDIKNISSAYDDILASNLFHAQDTQLIYDNILIDEFELTNSLIAEDSCRCSENCQCVEGCECTFI